MNTVGMWTQLTCHKFEAFMGDAYLAVCVLWASGMYREVSRNICMATVPLLV